MNPIRRPVEATSAPLLLAHQGGWDELLMFGVPILIALGAVKWAERRGAAKRTAEVGEESADEGARSAGKRKG